MEWTFNEDAPIYLQIVQQFKAQIASGRWQPGEKIPSVRELAAEASVNPNTMQKALSELERTGLVYSQRTSGRFITEDTKMIDDIKSEMAREIISQFLENMQKLGFQKDEAVSLMKQTIEGDAK